MQYGVHLPHLGRQADGPNLTRFAKEADRLGFHSGWVSDHIAWPEHIESKYPYTANGEFPAPLNVPWLDPLGTLIYVAGQTENLRLGMTVLILGYRPPMLTAKLLSTLDVLSNGRTILGAGVGWMREEFEVIGMPFDHRGARADEQLEIFDTLFTQPWPSYQGKFYSFPGVGFSPKPPQGHIPVWVGGDSEAAFKRTAKYGDAFHAAFTPHEPLALHWARVRQLCEERGRNPNELGFSVRVYLDFDANSDPAKALVGSPEQMLEQVERYRAMGVTHILLDILARGGVQGRLEAMQRFAAEVMPKTR